MISSIVVKKAVTNICFTKLEIDLVTGKMLMRIASYSLEDELLEHIGNNHRVYLPCTISTDPDSEDEPIFATMYIPVFWDGEAMENYTQALVDEIYLYKHQIPGFKNLKQIEQSFMLEMVVL